jgi:hypothetical protein
MNTGSIPTKNAYPESQHEETVRQTKIDGTVLEITTVLHSKNINVIKKC